MLGGSNLGRTCGDIASDEDLYEASRYVQKVRFGIIFFEKVKRPLVGSTIFLERWR